MSRDEIRSEISIISRMPTLENTVLKQQV